MRFGESNSRAIESPSQPIDWQMPDASGTNRVTLGKSNSYAIESPTQKHQRKPQQDLVDPWSSNTVAKTSEGDEFFEGAQAPLSMLIVGCNMAFGQAFGHIMAFGPALPQHGLWPSLWPQHGL